MRILVQGEEGGGIHGSTIRLQFFEEGNKEL